MKTITEYVLTPNTSSIAVSADLQVAVLAIFYNASQAGLVITYYDLDRIRCAFSDTHDFVDMQIIDNYLLVLNGFTIQIFDL